ncbi:R2-like ligand-binding oxidase [Alicyclobacillus herbarius]|uniref:R2-like ligand-binding oxidase n=1 Tax=Alicyclobacillus herbarius TaxID=122960 RepID=UPI002357F088|nr:R2-like ligand-binding oxidase [Alicyclobacillus herbarius]
MSSKMSSEVMNLRTFKTTSEASLQSKSFPLRLYEKAKKLGIWDPADIDFEQDKRDWAAMSEADKETFLRLLSQFQAGEESVALDLVPLIDAVARDGRLEEEMFLTTFLFEEAKHTEFFHRFLKEVVPGAGDLTRFHSPAYRKIFYEELPEAMGRLRENTSPSALVEAAVTYNMVVEGVIAESGYYIFFETAKKQGKLPGLVQGITYVKMDESRHISFGTYLIQRCLQADPKLWDVVNRKLTGFVPTLLGYIEENFDPQSLPEGMDYNNFLTYSSNLLRNRLTVLERALKQPIDEIYRIGQREVEVIG